MKAIGYRHGQPVVEKAIQTTGVPVAITFTADRQSYQADGRDVIIVRAEIVDAAGRVVPTADHTLQFAVTGNGGRLLGTGNGDPASHEKYTSAQRAAFHGLALLLAQTTSDPAAVTLRAESPGLQSAELIIHTGACEPVIL